MTKKEKGKKKEINSTREDSPAKNKHIFLHLILITILGFAVYANSLSGKFIWDDDVLVKDNLYIRNWSNLPKIFTKDIAAGGNKEYHFYRPLQIFSYIVDYSIWKLNVIGYHFTNILLHILVALGIYWLISVLFKDMFLSLFASLLFVVHPVHAEAVSYISGRADPLAALFILLAVIFYIKYLRSRNIAIFIFSWLSYIFAVLSKEYSLMLPLLLLLYHFLFKVKFRVKQFLPMLSVIPIYTLLRFITYNSILPPPVYFQTTLSQRIIMSFAAFADYISILFLPFNLHMEYGYKLFDIFSPKVIFGVVLLVLFVIWAFKSCLSVDRERNKNRLIFFSITWFFLLLLPQSNIYPLNAYMAEHWLYLPSVGFFIILGYGLSYLYQNQTKLKTIAIVLLLSQILFYSFLTVRQNFYWREPLTIYKRTLEYVPDSSRALNNLAKTYRIIDKDKYKEDAIDLYRKAIESNPNNVEAYNNLCFLYYESDEYDKAISFCKKAIELNPNYAKAYNNLGNVYKEINMLEDAAASYQEAIELNPEYANAYNNLGLVLYMEFGKKEEAIEMFKKAIAIDYELADAHNNLAVAYYYYKKQYDLAIKHCDKAIELGYKVHPAFLNLLVPFRKNIENRARTQ